MIKISEILKISPKKQNIVTKGWIKTFRGNRFISINDGSTINNLQCVIDFNSQNQELLKKLSTGTSIKIEGVLVKSIGKGQSLEVMVKKLFIYGESDPENFPIQPKKHSLEFLREKAHLRIRTSTFSSIMRIRSSLSFAIHKFFNDKGFFHVHTPIITGIDAEGAGEMFAVSTLDKINTPLTEDGGVDYSQDFFQNHIH